MKRSILKQLIVICCLFCSLATLVILLFVESKALVIFLLLVATPFVLLILYTIFYMKKRIIQPLNKLLNETNRIAAGDLSRKINIQTNDEVGTFIQTFEQMRVALYEQQQRQQQFEIARKNFIDSISHDLKTPLASISAYVEALQDGVVSTPDERQQYLSIIENKVAVLTKLSNELSLSYETPDTLSLTLQEVNCYSWSVDFLNDIETECSMKNITPNLRNAVPFDEKSNIKIDSYQFDRALLNITSNAFRYYQEYFVLLVEIRNNQLVISIKNDGAKTATKNLDQIFDRFYTEEKISGKGHLGLGLYTSKTIIHAMKGKIRAKQQKEIIEFQIMLPIFKNDNEASY